MVVADVILENPAFIFDWWYIILIYLILSAGWFLRSWLKYREKQKTRELPYNYKKFIKIDLIVFGIVLVSLIGAGLVHTHTTKISREYVNTTTIAGSVFTNETGSTMWNTSNGDFPVSDATIVITKSEYPWDFLFGGSQTCWRWANGSVGQCGSDSATVINNAVNSVPSGGEIVVVGDITITTPILIDKRITYKHIGTATLQSTYIKLGSNTDTRRAKIILDVVDGVDNSVNGIEINRGGFSKIEFTRIQNCRYGIYANPSDWSNNVFIEGNLINNCTEGIRLQATNANVEGYLMFINFIGNCDYGIRTNGSNKTQYNMFIGAIDNAGVASSYDIYEEANAMNNFYLCSFIRNPTTYSQLQDTSTLIQSRSDLMSFISSAALNRLGTDGYAIGKGFVELWRSSSDAYIDLKDDYNEDYIARIQKTSDDELKFYINDSGTLRNVLTINRTGRVDPLYLQIPDAAPASPQTSDIYYNITESSLQVYDSGWKYIGSKERILSDDKYYHGWFESIDGYTQLVSGTGNVALESGAVNLSTGETSSSYAKMYKEILYPTGSSFTWDKDRIFRVGISINSNTSVSAYIIAGEYPAQNAIGFRIVNDIIYGFTSNTAAKTEVTLLTFDTSGSWELEVRYTQNKAEFYVNGVYKGQSTTNLPTGTDYASTVLNARVENLDAVYRELDIGEWEFWQEG